MPLRARQRTCQRYGLAPSPSAVRCRRDSRPPVARDAAAAPPAAKRLGSAGHPAAGRAPTIHGEAALRVEQRARHADARNRARVSAGRPAKSRPKASHRADCFSASTSAKRRLPAPRPAASMRAASASIVSACSTAPASAVAKSSNCRAMRGDARVVDVEGDAARLRQHGDGLLGIAAASRSRSAGPRAFTWKPPSMISAQVIRMPCGCATEPWP